MTIYYLTLLLWGSLTDVKTDTRDVACSLIRSSDAGIVWAATPISDRPTIITWKDDSQKPKALKGLGCGRNPRTGDGR